MTSSLVPAALFWAMVLAGSFQGLVTFGRSVLAWRGGSEYLVPGVIFHEFLAQFEEGAAYVRRAQRPAYGLRWATAPCSTLRAFVAWENHPSEDGEPFRPYAPGWTTWNTYA